ncbi:MAG: Holliday junction branch migration DNA helicase RuvB [Desulfatiglandales bacterium]
MKDHRLLDARPLAGDTFVDQTLRPQRLTDYIGQEEVKRNLRVFIEAAKARNDALDHVLFYGSPGLGKTTLASIIANELGVNVRATSGPVLERPGDLAAILTTLNPRDVLFVDEIHRLNRVVEEILYPAMEDYHLDLIVGQGPSARTMRIPLPAFTLVGATTRAGLLTPALRDRFGVSMRLDFYKVEELEKIILRSAGVLKIPIDREAAYEIASRARGTPRIANRLLKRVRDFAEVEGDGKITLNVAKKALHLLEVDEKGLDKMDRFILITIIEKFQGGPIGIESLSVAVSEEKDTLEEVYEPYLIQEGFLKRTPRGRIATPRAYIHLGMKPPKALRPSLFEGSKS